MGKVCQLLTFTKPHNRDAFVAYLDCKSCPPRSAGAGPGCLCRHESGRLRAAGTGVVNEYGRAVCGWGGRLKRSGAKR